MDLTVGFSAAKFASSNHGELLNLHFEVNVARVTHVFAAPSYHEMEIYVVLPLFSSHVA